MGSLRPTTDRARYDKRKKCKICHEDIKVIQASTFFYYSLFTNDYSLKKRPRDNYAVPR